MQFTRAWRPAPRRYCAIEVAVAALAIFVLPALTCTHEARAQGFLEALFGNGPGYRPPPAPLRPRSAYMLLDPNFYPETRLVERTGAYRTLCVRHCDGYYWPVSYAVPPSRFYRDAGVCRQSCGSEASLFYHAVKDDPADMVDLTGRSYSALPMAFRYRKSLVEDCRCKPEPWSDSEAERHRDYARDEAGGDEARAVRAPAATSAASEEAPRKPDPMPPANEARDDPTSDEPTE